MGKNNPLVSVIIPVYNGERFLGAAIESVLAQSYQQFEIIIVDDGSTDGSAEVAKSYPSIRYFFQPHSGLPAALNKGLKEAKGEYFAFLDADDLWTKNKLEFQISTFNQRPDLDIVFGHHQRFYNNHLSETRVEEAGSENPVLPAPFKGTMLIKRDSFSRVGLFDVRLRIGDFIDWYKRATETGFQVLMLPDVLMKRRVHNDHSSIRNKHAVKDYVRILKASLDRQRKKAARENMGIEDRKEKS